jgi:hypothetical protein
MLIFLAPAKTFADSLKCYDGSKTTTYKDVDEVKFSNGLFVFFDEENARVVLTNSVCTYYAEV